MAAFLPHPGVQHLFSLPSIVDVNLLITQQYNQVPRVLQSLSRDYHFLGDFKLMVQNSRRDNPFKSYYSHQNSHTMQNMLIIQENAEINTSRVLRAGSLSDVIQQLLRIYVSTMMKSLNAQQAQEDKMIFDLQEVIDYYENFFDVRFLEKITNESNVNNEGDQFGDSPLMKVYNKKMLLDSMVDQLNECTTLQEQTVNPQL